MVNWMNSDKTVFEETIKEKTMRIEEALEAFLPKEEGYQKTVIEAMNYSVLAGGKRLRPMLMKETYEMFGGSGALIDPFMAAIEMLHNYSLYMTICRLWIMTNTDVAERRRTWSTAKAWRYWRETAC